MNGRGCRNCPACGSPLQSESLGWKCNYCKGFLDMKGTFHVYIEKPFMPPMTTADQIRAMTDEEMTEKVYDLYIKLSDGTLNDLSLLFCDGKAGCITKDGEIICNPENVKACILRRLQQPAKEGL